VTARLARSYREGPSRPAGASVGSPRTWSAETPSYGLAQSAAARPLDRDALRARARELGIPVALGPADGEARALIARRRDVTGWLERILAPEDERLKRFSAPELCCAPRAGGEARRTAAAIVPAVLSRRLRRPVR
jgi:hypothetical protein